MTVGVTAIKYEWKDGYISKIDPNTAGMELERLARRDQEIVPMTLVEESRPADAPLHACFTWDDTEAAAKYREDIEAKALIRAIKVVYVRNDTEEPLPPVRAFVSVVDEPSLEMYAQNKPNITAQRRYLPVAKVMSETDLRDQYVRSAFDSLVAWRQRYNDIEQFAGIFERIDALRQKMA